MQALSPDEALKVLPEVMALPSHLVVRLSAICNSRDLSLVTLPDLMNLDIELRSHINAAAAAHAEHVAAMQQVHTSKQANS